VPGLLKRFFGSDDGHPLGRAVRLPAHAAYVHWDLGREPLSSLSFDITMHTDPGDSVGEYLSPYNGAIDGHQIYFGIQTDVYRPDDGGIGKGCIFSTWWTFDAADTRPESDGFIQLGTHEGRFVGVRRAYHWGVGDYRLTLERADQEGDGDWFAMSIQPIGALGGPGVRPEATGPSSPLGALRFRRAKPDRPATIAPGGPAFLEIYSNAETYGDIPDWSLDLMAYGDGRRAVSARSEYPAFPYAEVPNADVAYAPERERVAMAFGRTVERVHPAAQLF
jgi:hypothetical protein